VRIIGGAFGGRRLASVGKGDANAQLRPTSDRVRESLFNILDNGYPECVADARVLDVFAGTGALGLEALSRGARHVTFIERGRPALKLLRENIRICDAGSRTQVIQRDACKPGPPTGPADLVFLDPPYGKHLGEQAIEALMAGGWLSPTALVVWEDNQPVAAPVSLSQLDERRYGDTVIRLFENRC
jgi:16S rRNA (guanine966-N2)-methyltransferase